MVKSTNNWDEEDVRINKSRQFGASNKARPRTKDRPDYSSAQIATIVEVDRGRVKCLIKTLDGKKIITAMKARELGKKSVVVGDLVSIVGDISGIDIHLGNVGELTPSIAAVASLATTQSSLHGIAHLRMHETDRVSALANEINKLAVS